MPLPFRLLPASLTHRVFALYAVTLLLFVGLGTGTYLVRELDHLVEQPQAASVMLIEVTAQAIQDSVVIGDYDTVARTLDKGVQGSLFARASFIDLQGGRIEAESRTRSGRYAPQWLDDWVAGRLYDVNRNVSVGGKDYGVLRLQFDNRAVASEIEDTAATALGLALVSLVTGLLLIRFALRRWLGSLEHLRGMVEDLGTGRLESATFNPQNAPTEIRRVVEMFNQTATLVREREATRRALDDQKFALDQHAIVSMTDVRGTITYANDRFCAISGYSRDELLGQNHRIIGSGMHETAFFTHMWETIAAGRVWHGEICNRNRNGSQYWVSATLVPLLGERGQVTQYIAIRTDITARKEAERAMVAAKEAAEQANRVKSDFLANMSHEIRTPMNGVIGMTDLVLDTELTSDQREYLGIVKSSADDLLQIVNDILDFSKIEAGRMRLESISFSLDEALRDTIRSLAIRGHQKNLEVLLDVAPEVPDRLMGDSGRLRQIIVNLVGNAVKFTEAGEIEVTVRMADEQPAGVASIAFSVRDTGIGIAPDKLQSIFESFSQADSSTTRRYGGTGLGLTISSQLVAMMGGSITVTSTVGVGSTFSFTLQLPYGGKPAPARYQAATRLHKLPVLVVDDNASSGRMLCGMLSGWGMDPLLVPTGAAALALLAQADSKGQHFALTLIDSHMPPMSGFEMIEHLRQTHLQTGGAPVVMLAPERQREDAMRCRSLGVGAYLSKPIAQSELFAAVMGALGEPVQARTRPERRKSPRAALRALKLLVAEDNPVNQTLAVRLLEKQGHQVQLANNGVEAVRAWTEGHFDAILMDVDMPLMNGHEATRRIRAVEASEAAGQHIPIIAMTAHAMEGARENCLRHGMDGYLAKPIVTDLLWGELERATSHLAPPPRIPGPAVDGPPDPAPATAAPDVADFARMRETLGDDAALFEELRAQFLSDAPRLLAQARAALARADAPQLAASAHAIKGVVAIFAAQGCVDACVRIEQEAASPSAGTALTALAGRLQTLQDAVARYRW
jgi:two-component system sensor histidine kinase/response regulator